MPTIQERRKFERVFFEMPVKLIDLDGEWDTKVLDISLKGALVEIPEGYPSEVDSTTMLEIHLDSNIILNMDCLIVHKHSNLMGIQFTNIDIESISHLKRIISLNCPNYMSLLDRELTNLLSERSK